MGIPGFFGWLLKKYKRGYITMNSLSNIDELYIDANCMLHPSCFKILDKTHFPNANLENEMIEVCIQDLDNLIKYVNPKVKLYVAVDGVAPFAKITQQRSRRYKSLVENQLKNKIKKNFGIPINDKWSNA